MTQDEDCNEKEGLSEEDGTSVIQTVHYLYIQVRNFSVELEVEISVHGNWRLFLNLQWAYRILNSVFSAGSL